MKKTVLLPLLAAAVLSFVSSCDNGEINLSSYGTMQDVLEADIPDEIELITGQTYTVRVQPKSVLTKDIRVRSLSDDYGVVDCVDMDDSTVVVTAIHAGRTTVRISSASFSGWSAQMDVTVKDMELEELRLEQNTVMLPCGESKDVGIYVRPENYPIELINFDIDDQMKRYVGASVQMDSATMKPFARIMACQVGEYDLSLVGKQGQKEAKRSKVKVHSLAVPVADVYFRTPVDTVFRERRLSDGSVKVDTMFTYRPLGNIEWISDGFISEIQGRNELYVCAAWLPENATILDVSYVINYAGTYRDKLGVLHPVERLWTDRIEQKGGKDIDVEEIQRMIADGDIGESYDDIKRYLLENFGTSRKPTETEEFCGVVRDFGYVDAFAWKVTAKNPAVITITVTVKYATGMRGLLVEESTKSGTIIINTL